MELRVVARRDPLALDRGPSSCVSRARRPRPGAWPTPPCPLGRRIARSQPRRRRRAGPSAKPGAPRWRPSVGGTPRSASRLRASGPWLPSGRREASMRTIPSAGVEPFKRRNSAVAACSAASASAALGTFVGDEHVEVAPIGDLGPAEAAHGDHRHGHARRHGRKAGRDDGGPEIGQGAARLGEARQAEDVPGCDADRLDLDEVLESPRPPRGALVRRRSPPCAPALRARGRRAPPCRRGGRRSPGSGR